ncbi:uncharacterized protein LOC106162132 [Lingula anatina]|uniref:Uncharacterized protein LOC106162132 n=1 Tax=Lingula anatina TaxID=7574 RepID=A0A1S3I904_LINAN|nr:uncharacterized protein LOC106162132 [Lingula anatina]|eukprot:XP_013394732.1 uncharacterized protein LOC106162132 [Lingula anatina]
MATFSRRSRSVIGLSFRRRGYNSMKEKENECLCVCKEEAVCEKGGWFPVKRRLSLRGKKYQLQNTSSPPICEHMSDDDASVEKQKEKKITFENVGKAMTRLRQRLRRKIHRRRLENLDTPNKTPGTCSLRKSARLAAKTPELKLYSPFGIETPGRSPLRLNQHQPKRFNFSSPNSFQRDLDSVASGIRSLKHNSNSFSSVIQKENSSPSQSLGRGEVQENGETKVSPQAKN